jgi:hypothetical protein
MTQDMRDFLMIDVLTVVLSPLGEGLLFADYALEKLIPKRDDLSKSNG